MTCDFSQAAMVLTAPISSLAAIFSGACAYLSYKLATRIRDELKSDERIIAGVPIHPDLRDRSHSRAVIQCSIFNKSKRKAYLNSVTACDLKGNNIEITWSDNIDSLGSPLNPCQLVGIVDSCSLFVRRNGGGDFDYARLSIMHAFSKEPMIVVFDVAADAFLTQAAGFH